MNYMTGDIRFTARMGDGSDGSLLGKLWSAGKRKLGGESVFMTHFTNEGQGKQHVAFAAPYPGSVVAVDLTMSAGACSARRTRSSARPMAPGRHRLRQAPGRRFLRRRGLHPAELEGDGLVSSTPAVR